MIGRRGDNKTSIAAVIAFNSITLGLFIFYTLITVNLSSAFDIIFLTTIAILLVILYFGTLNITSELNKEQKNLVESRMLEAIQKEQLSAIINNLTDAVMSTDKKGVITVYNAATLNLLDTNDSPSGKYISDILKLTTAGGRKYDMFRKLKSINSVEVNSNLIYDLGGGDFIKLEVSMSPIKNAYSGKKRGSVNGYIVIMRDITRAKSLEEERDEFISVISHELRTPVTIAEGSVSNLQVMQERNLMSDAAFKSGLDVAHEQIIFLSGIINDLSTLSRAERGVRTVVEEVDIRDSLSKLYNRYSGQARKKGLELNIDPKNLEGKIHTNRLYFEEILQNLIVNAIKYTPEGMVTVGAQRSSKNSVVFFVKDTGVGIGKADQKRIFDKFYRSEDYRTRETGGTGLGLYVANKLAGLINAEITLDSRINHGSTFYLTISAQQEN
jgi:Signal transduction histidine kinase